MPAPYVLTGGGLEPEREGVLAQQTEQPRDAREPRMDPALEIGQAPFAPSFDLFGFDDFEPQQQIQRGHGISDLQQVRYDLADQRQQRIGNEGGVRCHSRVAEPKHKSGAARGAVELKRRS